MRVKVMKYALGRYNEVERLEEVYSSEVYHIDREHNEFLVYNKQQEQFEWVSILNIYKSCKVELDDSKPEEEDSFKAIKEWLRWRGADED